MKINIYTDNQKLSKHYENALKEYLKRTSIFCKMSLLKYKKNCLKETDYIILVDKNNNLISSVELADKIKNITTYKSSSINFVLLSEKITLSDFDNYNEIISLSNFDINQQMLVVALSEQIYRAFTIINGKKYHK